MATYEGSPGHTRRQAIHYSCPCSAIFSTAVYVAIDAKSDPELAQELLADLINQVRCPVCAKESRADVPVAFHDPENEVFALCLPEWARTCELEQRATLLGEIAADKKAMVSPYVKDPRVVYGGRGLRHWIDAEEAARAAGRDHASAPAEAAPDEIAWHPISGSNVQVERGRVRVGFRRPHGHLEPLVTSPLAVRIMLHRISEVPLVVLAIVPAGHLTDALFAPLDVRNPADREVLKTLGAEFRLDVELYEEGGKLVARRELQAPLEENTRFVVSAAQEPLGTPRTPPLADAVEMFFRPDYDRLGHRKHNFAEDSFSALLSPAAVRLAVSVVAFWCDAANEQYLIMVQSFPLPWWRQIRSRVAGAAVEFGTALPRSLAEQALGDGLAASRYDLLQRLVANFAEVSLHLKPNDLDAQGEWENWSLLMGECKTLDVRIDPQLGELVRASERRAGGSIPPTEAAQAREDLRKESAAELVERLATRKSRLQAALELGRRPERDEYIDAVLAAVDKMSRGETAEWLAVQTRWPKRSLPVLVRGLESRKVALRRGCMGALAKIGGTEGAGTLVDSLLSEETELWKEAAKLMGALGPWAREKLLERAADVQGDGRERLAWALAYVAAHGDRGDLEQLASSGEGPVCELALRALALYDRALTAASAPPEDALTH